MMVEPTPHQDVLERRRQTDCSDHEKRLIGVEHESSATRAILEGMDVKVDKILEKVNRIDILEEKHSTQQADITRAHRKLELLETAHNNEVEKITVKVDELAKESRKFISETNGMARMAWIIWTMMGSGLFVLLVRVLFFAGQNGV